MPSPKKAKKDPAAKPKVAKDKKVKKTSSDTSEKTSPTYDVVLEAIQSVSDRKGCSVDMIKKFYMAKYPEKDWTRVKKIVKKALAKGLEEGIIIRPKAAENMTGMTGRFKIDKEMLKQKSKPKKSEDGEAKPKAKPKKDETSKSTAKSATAKVAGTKAKAKPGKKGEKENKNAPKKAAKTEAGTKKKPLAKSNTDAKAKPKPKAAKAK